MAWSGGKDSALALCELQKSERYEVVALLTTLAEEYDRISHHGVRCRLLEAQAEALALPLHKMYIPRRANNQQYESRMAEVLEFYRSQGVRSVAFGDIFLEDLRKYREDNLAKVGMHGVFPIWKRDTPLLARQFVQLGFQAVTVCISAKVLDPSFVGKRLDEDFFRQLPSHVDPCGENGEYHSFVFDGPLLRRPVRFSVGQTVSRDLSYFCDLLPLDSNNLSDAQCYVTPKLSGATGGLPTRVAI